MSYHRLPWVTVGYRADRLESVRKCYQLLESVWGAGWEKIPDEDENEDDEAEAEADEEAEDTPSPPS